jgi:TonB family protein
MRTHEHNWLLADRRETLHRLLPLVLRTERSSCAGDSEALRVPFWAVTPLAKPARRLLCTALSVCLLMACLPGLGVAAAPQTDAPTALQTQYEQALQEIARLQRELTQAKGEIERLQHRFQQQAVSNWLTEGNTHFQKQQYQEAIEAFTKAIAEQPDAAAAYHNRGLAYARLGDYQQAIEDFDNAMALGLKQAVSANEHGIAAYQLGNLEQARISFNQAITLDPQLGQAYNNRGIVHYQLGDYPQAIKDLRQASQLGVAIAAPYLQTVHDEVRQLQNHLQKAGLDPGPVDGIPGTKTLAALRTFQQHQGLPITGRFDSATREALGLQPTSVKTSQPPASGTPPRFIDQPKPEYPELARQHGWEGTVTLRLELLANGTVGQVEIAASSGYDVLDKAAQEAAQHWTHEPARHSGSPITRWVQLGVTFTLDRKTSTAP